MYFTYTFFYNGTLKKFILRGGSILIDVFLCVQDKNSEIISVLLIENWLRLARCRLILMENYKTLHLGCRLCPPKLSFGASEILILSTKFKFLSQE